MAAAPKREDFVTVKAMLPARPFPTRSQRQPVLTERLIVRALAPDDLAAFHTLRRQPEVMHFTLQGVVDKDLAQTQAKLDLYLPPNDETTWNFAICLKETGEMIGIGGNHNWSSSFGWPEVGYMIRTEYWGKGLATEFMRAFLETWEELPFAETEISVDPRTLEGFPLDQGPVPGQLMAVTEILNSRSQNVLRKCGFEHFITWRAQNTRDVEGVLIDLPTFRFFAKETKA